MRPRLLITKDKSIAPIKLATISFYRKYVSECRFSLLMITLSFFQEGKIGEFDGKFGYPIDLVYNK